MAKGVYTVQDGYQNPKPDSSFYSCATALLIFLILCIVLVTVPIVIKKISYTSAPDNRTGSTPAAEKRHGEYERRSRPEILDEDITFTQLSSTRRKPVSSTAATYSTTKSQTTRYVKPSTNIATTSESYGHISSTKEGKLSSVDQDTSTAPTTLKTSTTSPHIIISDQKTTPSKETESDTSGSTVYATSSTIDFLQLKGSTQAPVSSISPLGFSSSSSSSSPVSTEPNFKENDYNPSTYETRNQSSEETLQTPTEETVINTDSSDMSLVSSTTENLYLYTEGEYFASANSNTFERLTDNKTNEPTDVAPTDINNNNETSEDTFTYSLRDTTNENIRTSPETITLSTLIITNSSDEINDTSFLISTSAVNNDDISSSSRVNENEIVEESVTTSYIYEPTEIADFNSTDTEILGNTTEEIKNDSESYNYLQHNGTYSEYVQEKIESNTESIWENSTISILQQDNESLNNERGIEKSTVFSENITQKIEAYSISETESISTTPEPDVSNPLYDVGEIDDTALYDDQTERQETSVSMMNLYLETEITENNMTTGTCETNDCKVLASRMLSFMNHSTDPCSDFYEFACGGLRANEALLEYDPKKDVWRRIKDSMKKKDLNSTSVYSPFVKFYHSCMTYDEKVVIGSRIIQARTVLDSVGHFHDNTSWSNNTLSLTDLVYNLLTHHSAPLFDVLLDVDGKNPSKFAVKLVTPFYDSIFQSGASQDEDECFANVDLKRSYIKLNEEYNNYLACARTRYIHYLRRMDKALKDFGLARDDNVKDISAMKMLIENDILYNVTKNVPREGEMRRVYLSKEYELMTLSELQGNFPLINWKELLQRLLSQEVSLDTEVQVYFKIYFINLFNVLTQMDNRILHNALLAMFAHDLYANLVETRNPCDRAQYCLRVASSLMEDLSSGLYLETFSDDDLWQRSNKLYTVFDSLKTNLRKELESVEWLDDISREKAILKLNNISMVADGGRHVFNNHNLLRNRMDIEINAENYFNNSVELLKRYRRIMYSVYDTDPRDNETIWTHFILPYSTEAIAIYGTNMIVIPTGMLTEPLYHSTYSQLILTSTIGYVVAQEMFHHFDSVGIHYGTNGKSEESILSAESLNVYNEHIDSCWNSSSFSEMNITLANGKHVSFKLELLFSLNERLADEAAVQLALKSHNHSRNAQDERLLPWLNMNWMQLYFLSLTQTFCTKETLTDDIVGLFEKEHLPPPIRVNKIMENSEDFSKAFSCPVGSNMNPVVKCHTFPHLPKDDDPSYLVLLR